MLLWTVGMIDDIASDMSVFHRVDDIEAMPAARFFAFAARLPAYQGAVRFRFEQAAEATLAPQQATAEAARPPGAPNSAQVVPSTPAVMTAMLPGVVDFEG